MKSIAEALQEARTQNSWTQEELAHHSGLSVRTIQRIESGEVRPRISTIALLSGVLKLDLTQLFDEQQKKSNWDKRLHLVFHWAVVVGLNFIVMLVVSYLNFDLGANLNSRIGSWMLSFALPFFIIFISPSDRAAQRFFKFGFALLINILIGLLLMRQDAWASLFSLLIACLIYMPTLYFIGLVQERNRG